MIELTRKQVYFIRSTIRQVPGITSARRAPSITFRATPVGLLIQSITGDRLLREWHPSDLQHGCSSHRR